MTLTPRRRRLFFLVFPVIALLSTTLLANDAVSAAGSPSAAVGIATQSNHPQPALHFMRSWHPGQRIIKGGVGAAATGPVTGTPPLIYSSFHGAVQHHPRVYLLFWGPNWTTSDAIVTSSQAMLRYMAGSSYGAILTQYSDLSAPVSNDAVLAGFALDSSVPQSINDSTITNEITSVSNAHGWQNSADTQFVILPQAGASYSWPSGTCAVHAITLNGAYIYGVIAYLADPGFASGTACITGTGGGSFAVAMNTLLSHEFAEMVTDPNSGRSWINGTNEIGDLCAPSVGVIGPGGSYVQMLWDNISDRCVTYAASAYPTTVQSDHPTVYYRLGETSGNATNSATASVNPTNNASYQPGVVLSISGAIPGDQDTAVNFTSANAEVALSPDNGLPSASAPRTVEAWERTTSTNSTQTVLAYGTQSTKKYFMMSLRNAGGILHFDGSNPSFDFTAPYSLADGNWHQVALSYDGSRTITAFVDAIQIGQGILSATLNTSVPGSGLVIGNGGDANFSGNLDEVAIYPSALPLVRIVSHFDAGTIPPAPTSVSATAGANQASVTWQAPPLKYSVTGYLVTAYLGSTPQNSVAVNATSLSATLYGLKATAYTIQVRAMNGQGNGPPGTSNTVTPTGAANTYTSTIIGDRPVLYYRLGDPSGAITPDSSATGNNGAYYFGYTLNQPGALATDPDGAVLFDGSSGYVRTANSQSLSITGDISVEAWVKWTAIATNPQNVINKGDGGTLPGTSYHLAYVGAPNGSGMGFYTFIGNQYYCACQASALAAGQWYYLVGTRTAAGLISFYVNNVLVAMGSDPGGSLNNVSSGVGVGASGSGIGSNLNSINGLIDEAAIYQGILTSTQMTTHYNCAVASC